MASLGSGVCPEHVTGAGKGLLVLGINPAPLYLIPTHLSVSPPMTSRAGTNKYVDTCSSNISFHYHEHSNGVCPSFAAITASTLLGRLFTRCWKHCCRDLLPFSHKSIIGDRRWCWVIRPGSQSAFQFIPKLINAVEVRALCRPVKFFHTNLNKPFLYGPRFVHGGIFILEAQNRLECYWML